MDYKQIANEAFKAFTRAYNDLLEQAYQECKEDSIINSDAPSPDWRDPDNHDYRCGFLRELEECEVYLYVRCDGDWLIENSQYLQDSRHIVAAIPLWAVPSPEALAKEIEFYDDGECGYCDAE